MTTATDKEIKALKGEFATLKSDMTEIGKSVKALAKESVQEGENRVKNVAENGRERFDQAAKTSRRQLRNGWESLESEIEERPMTSLGVALGLGFVIGRILDR